MKINYEELNRKLDAVNKQFDSIRNIDSKLKENTKLKQEAHDTTIDLFASTERLARIQAMEVGYQELIKSHKNGTLYRDGGELWK